MEERRTSAAHDEERTAEAKLYTRHVQQEIVGTAVLYLREHFEHATTVDANFVPRMILYGLCCSAHHGTEATRKAVLPQVHNLLAAVVTNPREWMQWSETLYSHQPHLAAADRSQPRVESPDQEPQEEHVEGPGPEHEKLSRTRASRLRKNVKKREPIKHKTTHLPPSHRSTHRGALGLRGAPPGSAPMHYLRTHAGQNGKECA